MDYNALVAALAALGLNPADVPDVLRTSLYLNYLTAAHTFFTTTLNGPAPAGLTTIGYLFVQSALQSKSLLKALAKILDFYVAPAVDADLQWQYSPAQGHGPGSPAPWTYRQYFDNSILDANVATYNANVAAFRARYPIADHALAQLSTNFQQNIKTCCERVIADRPLLQNFYNDLYNNTLQIYGLTGIKSSGSDFHKGGQQVLILEFRGAYRPAGAGAASVITFKVVYKPGDLEADCLIVGNSAAVNHVIPGFMVNSLFEIYNATLAANPAINGLSLNTYRILPRNYNSLHGAGAPLPIRNAYGYIQYLNYDLEWGDSEWWGFYPGAASDFVVFGLQPVADETIENFYSRVGAFCAVASTFSIVDMHIENFRISQYNPYPIDLELSLTTSVNSIDNTGLVGQLGGLTASYVEGQDSKWVVKQENNPGQSYLERVYPRKYEANRLYRAETGRQKTLVSINTPYLFDGFDKGMQVLRAAQVAGSFNAWFARLNNVVVRFLPYRTDIFKQVITTVFITQFDAPRNPNVAFLPTLNAELEARVTQNYNAYVNGNLPNFLAFLAAISGPDYQNLDIPVFYYRINNASLDIVDSRGAILAIPPTIPITGNPAAPCQANVGRMTFFPNAPTDNNVRLSQVTPLGTAVNYTARFNLIQQSLLVALGLGAVPAVPQAVLPDFF